ncbi:NUDIX domain-containing protein [Desulfonatronospira sp.]|uniref:NUDIX domain-containing protein n=1 Tax=Desulfonatronospira sp. TaxID=1962951 RepID=UPI0025C51386|nr:NUDIX domain-containing protein [Desulfonatronospira sp.]
MQPDWPTVGELIEVVDSDNRPLAVLPDALVHYQGLHHRSVAVIVHDRHNRAFLRKRSAGEFPYPGRWDLSACGHVLAGESVREAALRRLKGSTGLSVGRIKILYLISGRKETNYEFVYFISAGRIKRVPATETEPGSLFLDPQGLKEFVLENPEDLTPWLVYFWRLGLIFRQGKLPPAREQV